MFLELLLLLLLILAYMFFQFAQNFRYWKKLGIPSHSSKIQLRFIYELFGGVRAMHDIKKEEYRMFEGERFYGIFDGGRKIFTIRDDFHLLRSVMIKDFDHFSKAQGAMFDTKYPTGRVEELTLKGITIIDGDEWKSVRSTFSPIFSSGKLKKMMPLIKVLNNKIEDTFSEYASNGEMFELKAEMGKYSMDAIASTAFGVDARSLGSKEDSEFVRCAKQLFKITPWFLILILVVLPTFSKYQSLSRFRQFLVKSGITPFLDFPNAKEELFFINVVESAIKQRRETKTKRNDLIDMMIEALDNSNDGGEDEDDHANNQFERDSKIHGLEKSKFKLNEDYIIATAIVLMQAGYDTTALTMSNALYELTLNPECQRRLQEELTEANINDYSVLQNLPYLDAVLHETLRMHPVLPALEKICTKEYKVPGTNVTIKPGDSIQINAIGIHYDPKYYTNPETFDPENFMKERKAERDPLTFMGFNQGPRSCIAMRFALLEMKICLSHLLTNFNFLSCEKTKRNFETSVDSFLGGIKGGAWVRCERR